MLELAAIEIGDGCKSDVRVWPHINALTGDELGRSSLIEEDERADHLALGCRQRSAHLEVAEVTRARYDQCLDRIDTDGVGTARLQGRIPAHVNLAIFLRSARDHACTQNAASLARLLVIRVRISHRQPFSDYSLTSLGWTPSKIHPSGHASARSAGYRLFISKPIICQWAAGGVHRRSALALRGAWA